MTSNGVVPGEASTVVRRVQSGSAEALAALVETFEELQTVLRCCERLVLEVAPASGEPDPVVVEAVWTMALLSYARCFAAGETGAALTEEDLSEAVPGEEALSFHRVLGDLRDHHTDPVANPRERFTVGVTQDSDGTAAGVAITSVRQPLVDDVTVRQTGAIAYALSALVDTRIEAQQKTLLFDELATLTRDELDALDPIDVTQPDAG